ncbi:MAG: hypothetical protein AUJ92_08775 [Armatimonadetes bacterium CG2_30_59_28]|nr:MAG: hypothetical protein AUJ92_08775 [Armatimonadetes bacterium CG2_30_59_28]
MYASLLSKYLKQRDRATIEEPRDLGKALIKKHLEPSDIVRLHREALRECTTIPGAISSEEFGRSMSFLSEVLRSYGLAPLRPLLDASVTTRFVAQVLQELQAQAAISDVGRLRIGRRYADNVQGDLENCLQIFHMQGLGLLSLESIQRGDGKVIVRGKDLFEGVGKGLYPQDHFTRGFLSAVVSRLTGQEMNCEEISCQGRGDKRCLFVVSPVDPGPIPNLEEKLNRVT